MTYLYLTKEVFEPIVFNIWSRQETKTKTQDGILVFGAFPKFYLFQGENSAKYEDIDLKRFNIQIIDGTWTPGGIGLWCPNNILVGGYAATEDRANRIVKDVYKMLKSFIRQYAPDVNVFTKGNDLLVDHRKVCGATVSPCGNAYIFGLYINIYVYNKIIKKLSVGNFGRLGCGLSEYGITTDMVLDLLKQHYSNYVTMTEENRAQIVNMLIK